MPTRKKAIHADFVRISTFLWLLAATAILPGCNNGSSVHFTAGGNGNAPASLSITSVGDIPPAGVSVLSLQLTITDARLNPGNVELLAAPVTVDLARLRTENSLLSSINVTAGIYNSIAVTVNQNPLLTFQNNTGSTVTVGSTNCANGAICNAALALSTNSQSVGLPSGGVTASRSTPIALILNLNLTNLLAGTGGTLSMNLGANGGISAAQLTSSGTPFESIEDVVGVVSAPSSNSFTLQTPLGSYSMAVNSSTHFVNFPTTVCTSPGFACLATGEIISANMNLQTNDTLVATDVFFEDANSTVSEIEGVVVGTGGVPSQFNMVVLQVTPSGSGPALGNNISAALNATPAPSFAIDNLVGTVNTNSLSFAGASDLIVGQEVEVQQGTGSTASVINAKRVLLRSSRITGSVSATAFPNFTLNSLPPFMQNASPAITQLRVETATGFTPDPTEYGGSVSVLTQIQIGRSLSARGQLFANSGTPTLLATHVVEH